MVALVSVRQDAVMVVAEQATGVPTGLEGVGGWVLDENGAGVGDGWREYAVPDAAGRQRAVVGVGVPDFGVALRTFDWLRKCPMVWAGWTRWNVGCVNDACLEYIHAAAAGRVVVFGGHVRLLRWVVHRWRAASVAGLLLDPFELVLGMYLLLGPHDL